MPKKPKLKESFRWLAPEAFKVYKVGKNKVQMKGVALKSNIVSKNKRKYVEEELLKRGSTLSRCPVTINHSPYDKNMRGFDPSKIAGHVDYADYDAEDGTLEYLTLINKQPWVDMVRNKDPRIKGVSVEADYLYNRCMRCGEKFYDMDSFYNHLKTAHLVKNFTEEETEPRGITFRALSLVVDPEVPGVPDTTTELWETLRKSSPLQLLETVTQIEKEKEEYTLKTVATKQENRMAYDQHLQEQTESDLPPTHPTEKGGKECPEGSHWDEEAGTCIPDEIPQAQQTTPPPDKTTTEQEEDHGCKPGEHWDGTKCVPNVEEQTHCPPGFTWSEEHQHCMADPIPTDQGPVSAPQFVPEPQIDIPKVDVATPAPAVTAKTVGEQAESDLPPAPFPTPQVDAPAALKQECPVGSHWDEVASTCIPDEIPEVVTGEAPVLEVKLPPMLKLGEPFADYASFEDCVSKNQGKVDDPEAYCATIKRKTEGETVSETLAKDFPALHSMGVRHTVQNIHNAEAINKLNLATATLYKGTIELPRTFHKSVLTESALRARDDKRLQEWTKKGFDTMHKNLLQTAEAMDKEQSEVANKQILASLETSTKLIQTTHEAMNKNVEANFNKLTEYVQKKDGQLATALAMETALNKINSATIKRLETQLTETIKKLGQRESDIEALNELNKKFEEFKKTREQEEEHTCPTGEHWDDTQGKCVADEEPEAVTELKKQLTETLTRVENLEAKQKGQFKAHSPIIKETKKDEEYVDDPVRRGKRN